MAMALQLSEREYISVLSLLYFAVLCEASEALSESSGLLDGVGKGVRSFDKCPE